MRRILVIRAGALGDTLMATPVVRALAGRHPGARIDFLASAPAAPLLSVNPRISQVHVLRGRNIPLPLSPEKRRLVAVLRAARYDLIVLLESARRFWNLAAAARPGAIRSFLDIQFDPHSHAILNNLRAAGCEPGAPEMLDMDLAVSEDAAARARELLDTRNAGGRTVGMHAGYGPAWKKSANQPRRLKGWDTASFARLAKMLIDRGARLVLTGSAEDRAVAERIAASLPSDRVVQLAGRTTVAELGAVIARTDLFVSVDSGPAHMAAALAVPLVVLWGPSRLEQVKPLSSRSPVCVVRHPVFCAPCYDTPLMKTCARNICMESISPAAVLRAIHSVDPSISPDCTDQAFRKR